MISSSVHEKKKLLSVSRFHFNLIVHSPISFSKNIGAMLRGGFGNALKKVTCTIPDMACLDCPLYRICAYPYLFETPPPDATSRMPKGLAIPRPFVIEPPIEHKSHYEPGEAITFGLVLIGKGIDYLPYFVRAFETLGQRGMGASRGKFKIQAVDPVLENAQQVSEGDQLTLRFLTPARIVGNGHPVAEIDFPVFFRTLSRRITNLQVFHGAFQEALLPDALLSRAKEIRVVSHTLRWFDQERYSRRQNRSIPQGGLVGEIVFEGEMGPFLPYLQLGELVHVGKGATFGMGRYEMGKKEYQSILTEQENQNILYEAPSTKFVEAQDNHDSSLMVMGDLSGIQTYIFDVSEAGGGQAKRLRSRSFRVQVISELAALKVLDALGWTWDHVVYASSGKFLFSGPSHPSAVAQLKTVLEEIERHLLGKFGGILRFSLAWENTENAKDNPESLMDQYEALQAISNRAKMQSWTTVAQGHQSWLPDKLVLKPLNTPCAICRHVEATEYDEQDGIGRNICIGCRDDENMGRQLPKTTLLLIEQPNPNMTEEILGYGLKLTSNSSVLASDRFIAAVSLSNTVEIPDNLKTQNLKDRHLARYIPLDATGAPLQFTDIANKSRRGDKLLGILKADVDSLGLAIHGKLKKGKNLAELGRFSKEIDDFFSTQIIDLMKTEPFDTVYTIFSGGDDLLLVGPWDIIIDFSEKVQLLFSSQLGVNKGLTLSAGIAIAKPRVPIKFAVEQADELLDIAKTNTSAERTEPKDQCAVLGQIWKWSEHSEIINAGKQIADWIDADVCSRGWVQGILRLSEARKRNELISTSRLAYLISRNFPSIKDRDRDKAAFRLWADTILGDFDASDIPHVRYLPSICRYALTATRVSQTSE